MPPKPLRAVTKSRSLQDREEESIYNLGKQPVPVAGPTVRTYNVAPPTPGGAPPKAPVRMHADSSQIEGIMNPVRGPREAMVRAGIKPPNHARANAAAVKEMSQLNGLRKVAEQKAQVPVGGMRSTSAPSRRPAIQRSSSDAGTAGRDFVNENKLGAAAPLRPPRADSTSGDGAKYLNKKDYGKVPDYLIQRKFDMAAEADAQARAKEAALIPPGMRILPEEERMETLAILRTNREEVERAITALPLRIETPSAIRRKDELERRLREIEDAQKIFSRPKVMVHI